MKATKIILATVAGGIVNFLASWLIYGILLADTFEKGMNSEVSKVLNKPEAEMNYVLLFLASLASAALLAYIYERWAKISTFTTGAVAGAVIFFLVSLSMELSYLAMTTMYANNMAVVWAVLTSTLVGAITGAAVAWVLGFKRS